MTGGGRDRLAGLLEGGADRRIARGRAPTRLPLRSQGRTSFLPTARRPGSEGRELEAALVPAEPERMIGPAAFHGVALCGMPSPASATRRAHDRANL